MNLKIQTKKLIYRKLKISDFPEFQELFYLSFGKRISYNFFKWRYFTNKLSFCYGAFESSKLIANVGLISMQLNNNRREKIFSRHSSMVLKKYRGQGIFSFLLDRVKKKISKKVNLVAMWPNENNFSNFGIENRKIIKKKLYLYKIFLVSHKSKKTENFKIEEINKFKDCINNKNSFFYKNLAYFKNRYLSFKKNDYIINKFSSKKLTSFFILKINKDKLGLHYVILDYFGSEKLKSKHFSYLINDQKKLIFLSTKKINKPNFKLLKNIYFKIGSIKNSNFKKQEIDFFNKEIFLGDTDIFMTIKKQKKYKSYR